MKLRFERFSTVKQGIIQTDFQRMKNMAAKTAGANLPVAKWFGAADRVRLNDNLAKMRTVINDGNRSITFVNREGGVLKVEYKSLLSPHLMDEGNPGNKLVETDSRSGQKFGALAYVFPANRMNDVPGAQQIKDLDPLDTSSHVGSGMRIYLTEIYFKGDDRARAATLYHELTHKVLACEDICYESGPCQALAATPRRALRNADNYAMFLLEC